MTTLLSAGALSSLFAAGGAPPPHWVVAPGGGLGGGLARRRVVHLIRFAVGVHQEGDRQLARADLHLLDAGAVAVVDLEELVVDVEVQTVVVATPAPDPAVRQLRDVLAEEVDLAEHGRDVG